MAKFKFKSLGLILLCIITLLPTLFLSGCMDEVFSIYFGVEEMPYNLDPQKAQTYGELLAVRNCFKGLFKEDTDGSIVPDLAETYTTSDDKLTYTFKIKDCEWKDGTPITADDFVFAISRAKDPITASPSAKSVENIEYINKIDSKSFTIKLIKPDENFLKLLTSAVFKPCNREFFEKSGGKYGLSREYILTNGDYSIANWNERQIKLKLAENHKNRKIAPENVFITVSSTGKNSVERINNKEIGMAINSINDWTSVNQSEYNIISNYSKSYALIFNKNTEIGKNTKLTSAFAKSVHKEYYSVRMSQRFTVPKSVIFDNTLLSNIPNYAYQFDSNLARTEFLEALQDFKGKKLPSLSVLTAGNDEINAILGDIVSQWQNHLGAYVNITKVNSESQLLEKVKSGNFTIALVPLEDNTENVLKNFADTTSGFYLFNTEFNQSITQLNDANTRHDKDVALTSCATILSNESTIIPIVSVPTSYIYDKNYKNVYFSTIDTTIDFTIISKVK